MTLLYVTGVDNKVYDLSESLFLCLYKVDIINSAYTYMNNISCRMDAFLNGTANGTYHSIYHNKQQELYEIVFVAIMLFLSSLTATLLELRRRARKHARVPSEDVRERAPPPLRGGKRYK